LSFFFVFLPTDYSIFLRPHSQYTESSGVRGLYHAGRTRPDDTSLRSGSSPGYVARMAIGSDQQQQKKKKKKKKKKKPLTLLG
jgi:hypothetical protein